MSASTNDEGAFHVLVVDDNSSTRTEIRTFLSNATISYKVTTVESVQRACEVLLADKEDLTKDPEVDLIIASYDMTGRNGNDLLQFVMNDCPYRVPVIIMSTQEEEKIKNMLLKGGASGFLRKPLNPSKLYAQCQEILCS